MKLAAEARAKVNLAIDVLHRREDGYHQLAMIAQSISLADRLVFTSRDRGISLSCSDPDLDSGEGNLVLRAARALHQLQPAGSRRGADIHLEKRIPVEAGLGGGSSDAAATLLALNRLWGLGLSLQILSEIGFSLGADIPFCMQGGTALVEGVGEKVTPLPPFPSLPLVLVKPPFGLSTAQVYRSLSLDGGLQRPDLPSLMAGISRGVAEDTFPFMVNVLEEGTGNRRGEILSLKEELQAAGARKALMSGSGSVVFGFFQGREEAAGVASGFRSRGFWSQAVTVSPKGVELQAL